MRNANDNFETDLRTGNLGEERVMRWENLYYNKYFPSFTTIPANEEEQQKGIDYLGCTNAFPPTVIHGSFAQGNLTNIFTATQVKTIRALNREYDNRAIGHSFPLELQCLKWVKENGKWKQVPKQGWFYTMVADTIIVIAKDLKEAKPAENMNFGLMFAWSPNIKNEIEAMLPKNNFSEIFYPFCTEGNTGMGYYIKLTELIRLCGIGVLTSDGEKYFGREVMNEIYTNYLNGVSIL